MEIFAAVGMMELMSTTDTAAQVRVLRLEASIDGSAVLMSDVDLTEPGVHREVCYRISVAELVSAIQKHGVERTMETFIH
jgi:hypothetical protein